jgi:hypothetical protein
VGPQNLSALTLTLTYHVIDLASAGDWMSMDEAYLSCPIVRCYPPPNLHMVVQPEIGQATLGSGQVVPHLGKT